MPPLVQWFIIGCVAGPLLGYFLLAAFIWLEAKVTAWRIRSRHKRGPW